MPFSAVIAPDEPVGRFVDEGFVSGKCGTPHHDRDFQKLCRLSVRNPSSADRNSRVVTLFGDCRRKRGRWVAFGAAGEHDARECHEVSEKHGVPLEMKNKAILAVAITMLACRAATAGIIYTDSVLADNPVAYWRLGEATGPSAFDEVTMANNANYGGGETFGVIPGAFEGEPTATSIGCSTFALGVESSHPDRQYRRIGGPGQSNLSNLARND